MGVHLLKYFIGFMLFSIFFISIFAFSSMAFANPIACAVCTVAIAGCLGISRLLGVPDMVVGVWVGAILLAISQWSVYYFEKKNKKTWWIVALCYIFSYSLILPLYFGKNPTMIFNLTRFCGVDSFLISIFIGSIVLYTSSKIYSLMKVKNGGKPHFQFEKVILPISSLCLV